MHCSHQHVLVIGAPEKLCPQGDLGGQIERVTSSGADGLTQPTLRPCGGIRDQPAELRTLGRDHLLEWHTVDLGECGAQRFVAVHHIGQRGAQRVGVERAVESQCHRHVVDR